MCGPHPLKMLFLMVRFIFHNSKRLTHIVLVIFRPKLKQIILHQKLHRTNIYHITVSLFYCLAFWFWFVS